MYKLSLISLHLPVLTTATVLVLLAFQTDLATAGKQNGTSISTGHGPRALHRTTTMVQKELEQVVIDEVCPKDRNKLKMKGRTRRTKRDAVVIIVVSQLISVITGSMANDFIVSSFWQKVTFCSDILWRNRGRGWKRCWVYAQLGEHKWRKLLKAHLMAELLRMAGRKLRAVDKGGKHYKHALLLIQKEFNQLLLEGDQAIRLMNLLRNAQLDLTDLAYKPLPLNAQQSPAELAAALCKMDWHETGAQLHFAFGTNQRLLAILHSIFEKIFEKVETNKPKEEMFASLLGDAIFTVKSGLTIEPNWKVLSKQRPVVAKHGDLVGKFFAELFAAIDADFRPGNAANQLFLHAVLAGYAQKFLEKSKKNADPLTEGNRADNITKLGKLSKCLVRLTLMENKFGKFQGDFFKGKQQANAPNGEQKRLRKFDIMMAYLESQIDKRVEMLGNNGAEEFANALLQKYEPIMGVHAADHLQTEVGMDANGEGSQKDKNEKNCIYAVDVLLLDLNTNKMSGLSGQGQKMAQIVGDKIQKDFFAATKSNNESKQQSPTAKQIQGQLQKSTVVDQREVAKLLVHLKMAILGHVLSQNLVEHSGDLNKLAKLLDLKWVQVDEGLPEKFKTVSVNLLEHCYDKYGMFRGGNFMDTLNDGLKAALNSSGFKNQAEKLTATERLNRINGVLKAMVKEMRSWLAVTVLQQPNPVKIPAGPKTIKIPIWLSAEMMETTLKQVLYAQHAGELQEFKATKGGSVRVKRLSDLIIGAITGLITGFLGNWISEEVDVSKSLRNWFLRFQPSFIKVAEARRKQREKGILTFLEHTFKVLLGKIILLEKTTGEHMNPLVDEMNKFLEKAVHAEGVQGAKQMDMGRILIELDILSYRDFRHHIERIIEEDQQEEVIFRVLSDFYSREWINREDCGQNFERVKKRLRKKLMEKAQRAQLMNPDAVADLMEKQWTG